MRHSGVFFGAAKPAVKVPEVGTFGQVAAPFALDVFANFVFDGSRTRSRFLPSTWSWKVFLMGDSTACDR